MDDTRICKLCEHFGCGGECQEKAKDEKKRKDAGGAAVRDEGQTFEMNKTGLIDRDRTKQLFKGRLTRNPGSATELDRPQVKRV